MKNENTIKLTIRGAGEKDLKPLEYYDESLVRRVWIKENLTKNTDIKIVLKDSNVRFHFTEQTHPYRISLEFFDKHYKEPRDPLTGLPLIRDPISKVPGKFDGEGSEKKFINTTSKLLINKKNNFSSSENSFLEESKGKRKLLQPLPEFSDEPQKRIDEINQLKAGLADGWKKFPLFIYRINTAPYKNTKNYDRYIKNLAKPQNSIAILASHASKLYDFGHEIRALAAYRYILQNSPQLFNNNPIHLWKLSELHFSHQNFTLAKGYYQSLIDQFSENELAGFARLRLLDIAFLEESEKNNFYQIDKVYKKLEEYKPKDNGELNLQVLIRLSYYHNKNIKNTLIDPKNYIPVTDNISINSLIRNESRVESQKTLFLTKAIILNSLLTYKSQKFSEISPRIKSFLSKYGELPSKEMANHLKIKSTKVLNGTFSKLFKNSKFLEIIELVESIPASLKVLKKTPKTLWAISESYKNLGQYTKASGYFNSHAKTQESSNSFISSYWSLFTLIKSIDIVSLDNNSSQKEKKIVAKIKKRDKDLYSSYKSLNKKNRKNSLEKILNSLDEISKDTLLVSTPPRILTDIWENSLITKEESIENPLNVPKVQPSSSTVSLLINLKKSFDKQGMKKDSERIALMLTKIDPKIFKNDISTKKIWATELLNLASYYKKNSRFLDAGRVYALSGREEDGWEGRAEALYKGGLLLYRAGRRKEAIEAFEKASNDGNNLLYAELARKRLEQLTTK